MDGWMKGYINKKMLEMPFKNRILIHYDPFPSPMDLFRSIHSPTVNKKLFFTITGESSTSVLTGNLHHSTALHYCSHSVSHNAAVAAGMRSVQCGDEVPTNTQQFH